MAGHVYVTGLGVISAIGNSAGETLRSFEQGRSGVGAITRLQSVHRGVLPVAEVKAGNEELCHELGAKPHISRTALLGMKAALEALQQSDVDVRKWRTGLISGTTVGGMDKTEDFFATFLRDPSKGRLREVVNHECGMSTELIAEKLGIKDFLSTINTACSSSVNAIILGTRLIRHGHLDVVVAGGTDALTRFTINGFNSLMILDREPSRPFDASRAGLNLGEGAGFVVIVSEKVLKQTGVKPLALVKGFANTNDSFHQTASSPEGRGSFAAMQHALDVAGVPVTAIDYINLHGTGTQNNDSSEGTAIQRLFGARVPRLSSTKAFTGHTLGASGGIEAVFSVMAIQQGCVFPNLRFHTRIPELDFTPQTEFETGLPIRHVLSNSFGFGGNCSSIIFAAPDVP